MSHISTTIGPAGKAQDAWVRSVELRGYSGRYVETSIHDSFLSAVEEELIRLTGDKVKFVSDDGVSTSLLTDHVRRCKRALELPPREDGFAAVGPDVTAAAVPARSPSPQLPPPSPLVRETFAEKAARRAATAARA